MKRLFEYTGGAKGMYTHNIYIMCIHFLTPPVFVEQNYGNCRGGGAFLFLTHF